MVSLGDFPGNQRNGVANGVSADGSVVVGYGSSERSRMIEGFRWTAETGLVPLGSVNPNHIYSAATDVSADGQVVAGYSYNGTGFRWTAGEGMVPIGGWGTAAWAISADGTAIVGTHAPNGHTQPYRWTVETGIVSLGRPAGFIDALGLDVSADGSIVVGRGNGNQNDGSHALIWDADHGNRRLDGVLAGEYGLDLGDYELIGPDELWVPFIATIPEPSTVMLLILLAAGARKASR
ncbi:MAG: hypothetical protein HZB38_09315 [Planctomycetes bacterium]|nr:hypothetical protein [Planctomycetota bacterium]